MPCVTAVVSPWQPFGKVITIFLSVEELPADSANSCDLEDELIPVAGGLANVPLRQVADVVPAWENGQIVRRNGIYTITVMADLQRGENGMDVTGKVQKAVANLSFLLM